MKLLSIRLHPFGGTANRICTLYDGINVLEGPNEFGKSTLSNALWRALFTPTNQTPAALRNTMGRWYAMPGEGGTIMLSNPFAPDIKFTGKNAGTQQYFNECLSGFEHQVATHMMWENTLTESLAVTRVIHDGYHPRLRNPCNEIECSDHYGRAMASYGTYLAACGYEYDGPKKHLGLIPRLTPDNFKAAFTNAEGWGTFSQQITGGVMEARIAMKSGQLALSTLALATQATKVTARLDGKPVAATVTQENRRATVAFDVSINAGQTLVISLA